MHLTRERCVFGFASVRGVKIGNDVSSGDFLRGAKGEPSGLTQLTGEQGRSYHETNRQYC
jgi:hypothetical protein